MTDLAGLRRRFIARAAEDLAALRAENAGASAPHIVHRLSGTAGVFGFEDLSRLANVVDDQLHAGEAPADADWAALLKELARVSVIPA